jgi:hypothetical protein
MNTKVSVKVYGLCKQVRSLPPNALHNLFDSLEYQIEEYQKY